MRGSLGRVLYDIEQMKRRGELPPDFNPFPPKLLALTLLPTAIIILVLLWIASFN